MRLLQVFGFVLARKSQNHMSAGEDSPLVGALDGLAAAGEIVSAVDMAQRVVIGAFDAIFHDNKGAPVELLQLVA